MDLDLVLEQLSRDWDARASDLEQNIHDALFELIPYSDEIPYPAQGNTLKRWQILSRVAGINLSLAKIFESHLDALAILYETGHAVETAKHELWAVWAAEGANSPLTLQDGYVSGTKNWCSAAHWVNHAVMTYRDAKQNSQLLMVHLAESGIQQQFNDWHAVGMQHTHTAQLHFDHVPIELIGEPNLYLTRAGFWHGAAGVAACWFGAAQRLAQYLHEATVHKPHAYKYMYLGEMTSHMFATQALFYQTAQLIDAEPEKTHELQIRALRANVENTVLKVLELTGKALGAAPYCNHANFAQLAADLPVFIRQSHAAFDLERIGELALQEHGIWII